MKNARSIKLITEATAVAAVPIFGYLILLYQQRGVEKYYSLPSGFNVINPLGAINGTLEIMAQLFLYYALLELVSYLIPAPRGNAVLVRLKRIIPLVGMTVVLASMTQSLRATLLMGTIVALPLIISDFVLPLIRLGKGQRSWSHFQAATAVESYKNTYVYLRHKAALPVVALLLLLLALSLEFASYRGYQSVQQKEWFIVLNATPKEVVLIDYGEYLLTSQYDEQNPHAGPWNTNLHYRRKSDLGQNGFRYMYIPNYYSNSDEYHE